MNNDNNNFRYQQRILIYVYILQKDIFNIHIYDFHIWIHSEFGWASGLCGQVLSVWQGNQPVLGTSTLHPHPDARPSNAKDAYWQSDQSDNQQWRQTATVQIDIDAAVIDSQCSMDGTVKALVRMRTGAQKTRWVASETYWPPMLRLLVLLSGGKCLVAGVKVLWTFRVAEWQQEILRLLARIYSNNNNSNNNTNHNKIIKNNNRNNANYPFASEDCTPWKNTHTQKGSR